MMIYKSLIDQRSRKGLFIILFSLLLNNFNAGASPSSASALQNTIAIADNLPASTRFAVIGDFGIAGQPEADVSTLVKSWNPDFVITVGDNNYPDGSAATIDNNIGQYYHEFINPYTGSYGAGATFNRFFPALGNHDWSTNNIQPYLDYFSLPGNERYYDFVQGPIHFFVLDSDPHEPDGITSTSVQAIWLQNALASSNFPWNIVYMHHSPYSSGLHGSTPELQWPFAAWGADAVLSGHDHTYERITRNNIPYFVVGLGGYSIYNFGIPVTGSEMRYNGDYGAMLVNATASEIIFNFISRGGDVIDTFSMSNGSLDPAKVQFQEIASGLNQPVLLTHASDGSGRLFIVERTGRIRILKKGSVLATPFLNIQSIVNSSGSEQGLLALTFHPGYATNGKFYTVHTNQSGTLVLSQFTRSATDPDQANPNSRIELLTINHPTYTNHNGGTLAFGPDGYLYWSTGDGGSGGDPNNNAQNLSSLLGKILRLDVDSSTPYAIPPGNPFYNNPNLSIRKEIWAYGLRNPWRLAFDRLTGDIFIGDVGQSAREEIDFQPFSSAGGENYGWRVMEGSQCYNPSSGCDQSDKVLPIAEYDHTVGCSVTGGYIYRGSSYPSMRGHYFYADYCNGKLFDLYRHPQNGWISSQILDTPYTVSSFGEDEAGELYLLNFSNGRVYQIRYQEALPPPAHDDFDTPRVIGNISYNDLAVDTTGATAAPDDPANPACNLNQGQASVWYRYTPSADQSIYLDTFNSSYDTFIAAWTGSRGSLNSIGCNDDADGSTLQSALGLSLNGGTTYYIEIAQINGAATGGSLNFHVRTAQTADIFVGGDLKGHYFLPTDDTITTGYPAVLDGPVRVVSTDGLPIFTSQKAFYGNSFNELMGYPADQFTTEYWFPWYDNVYMQTWILVGNPSATDTANVEIYIGGQLMMSPSIPPNGRVTPMFGDVLNGPVRVVCINCASYGGTIFASERSLYGDSFSEVMGYPDNQLTTEYWFPWYDNIYMQTWILVGNPSASQTAYVDISIGGDLHSYSIPPNGRITPQFPGQLNGPVQVVSTTGAGTPTALPIFASERSLYGTSFNEVMGYPSDQFTTEYFFPWYDQLSMQMWVLVGNPSATQTANVDIYIGGIKRASTSILPNGRWTPQFSGVYAGPLRVVSTNGVDIFASERALYGSSFNEMMGYPADQLTTEYWFPWYDNVFMNTEILLSHP